jgi:hypothetical protein
MRFEGLNLEALAGDALRRGTLAARSSKLGRTMPKVKRNYKVIAFQSE